MNIKNNIEKPADQNTLFRKYVIFEQPSVYFKPMTLYIFSSKWLQWPMAG